MPGSKKGMARLAQRLAAQPTETRNKAGHVQHKPGSQNGRK